MQKYERTIRFVFIHLRVIFEPQSKTNKCKLKHNKVYFFAFKLMIKLYNQNNRIELSIFDKTNKYEKTTISYTNQYFLY